MRPDRRSFLRLSALAGATLAAGGGLPAERTPAGGAPHPGRSTHPDGIGPGSGSLPGDGVRSQAIDPAPRSLRLLVLGGTGFIGPWTVAYAVARGHRVTVFNRGRAQADLPPGVEQLTGDRNLGEVDALRGREWDAVLDNPTTLPFWVRDVGRVLGGRAGRYLFISTLSAYDLTGADRLDEDTPLLGYAGGDPLAVTPEQYQASAGALYGPMKAAAEAEAGRWFGADAVIVRPGLIVGPGDSTDRFTYWPVRIARGGDVVAPGDGTDPVQIIDVRDLAEWTVRLVEEDGRGTFNAVGPRSTLTMAEQLAGIRAALPGDLDLRIHWAPMGVLQAEGVRPWSEMTTWFGPGSVLARASNRRAVSAGLTYRPLAVTARDTLEWFRTLPPERQAAPRAGLPTEKEERVLAALRRG